MKLDRAIKVEFPKSEAVRFTVWDELNRQRFSSAEYASGNYPHELMNKPVTSISVSWGVGGVYLMCINIDTGEKALQEVFKAAYRLQSLCEDIMRDPEKNCNDSCPFWDNRCTLRDDAPAGWSIPVK